MRNFKGNINGRIFTDQKEFEKVYKEMCQTTGIDTPINVSYTIEIEDEDLSSKAKDCGSSECNTKHSEESEQRKEFLSETDGERLCSTVETIRSIVEETSARIQNYIDSDEQSYKNTRELSSIIDAAITKINWLVQALPSKLRRVLCESVYEATEEMVDKIESELVDDRYELSKSQEIVSDEIREIDEDIKEVEDEIRELEEEKAALYKEIDTKHNEYDSNSTKIETIGVATRFFDGLLNAFTI